MMIRTLPLVTALLLASCQSTPAVTTMESVEPAPQFPSQPAELVRAAEAPAMELTVEPREVEGVKGAAVAFVLPGTPEEVLELHFDVENMEGHRSIAESFELVERTENLLRVVWHLKRHKIVKPTVTLRYEAQRQPDGSIELVYELEKGALGVAANFGRKSFLPLPGSPSRTLVRWETYFDTGMPLFKISADELAEAMQEDIELLRAWQATRLAP